MRSKSAKGDKHRRKAKKKSKSQSSHSEEEESNSSNECLPALRAPTRAPNVEVGWRTPLGQLEQAPISQHRYNPPTPIHTSQANTYITPTQSPTAGPPSEFIGPQSAFRNQPAAARPSIKPTTTTAEHAATNTTQPTAPTPTPSQAPDSQATQPPPDSSSTLNTASQATDTNTATSNPTPAPPGPPPTIGQPTPQYQPRTRHDPYTHIHTQVKAAPPLPEKMAWKMAPGKWGDPLQIVQAMVDTTTELVNKADQVLEKRQGNTNTTPTAGSTPLPPPPPPPPTPDASQQQQHNRQSASNIPLPPDTTTHSGQQSAYQTLRSKLQKQKTSPATPNPADTKVPAMPIQLPTQPKPLPPPPTRTPVQLSARAERRTVTLIPNKQANRQAQQTPTPTTATPTATPSTSHTSAQPAQLQQPTETLQSTTTPASTPLLLHTNQAHIHPTQVFEALQTKATQHTQQPDDNITQPIGPQIQQWQMVEQVPSTQQDKEEYERNKHEFKSWKGVLRYPAPPQEMWDRIQTQLTTLCEEENVPNLPQYEHKYISALLAANGPTVKDQIERVQFYVSEDQAVWILRLRRTQPPILAAAWTFSYQFYHGTETGSLWNILREGVIRPTLADQGSVGFYGRCTQENTPWSNLNTIRRVIDSGKWSTPAIIGGVVETTCQHHTMNSGSGEQAQTACRTKGLVHMKRDKKWVIRSDLAQITCLAIPVLRESNLTDLDARGHRISSQSMLGR